MTTWKTTYLVTIKLIFLRPLLIILTKKSYVEMIHRVIKNNAWRLAELKKSLIATCKCSQLLKDF